MFILIHILVIVLFSQSLVFFSFCEAVQTVDYTAIFDISVDRNPSVKSPHLELATLVPSSHSNHVIMPYFQMIGGATKTNSDLASVRFPALCTGFMILFQALIGYSLYLRFFVIGQIRWLPISHYTTVLMLDLLFYISSSSRGN